MKALTLILVFFTCLLSAEIRHQYTLPNNTDELGQLYINSNEDLGTPTLPKLDGLLWGSPSISRQTQIINGRRSDSSSLRVPFKVLKTGKFIIPSFKLGSHTIPAIDFKVEASPYDEAYFIKTNIDKESESLYPGQHFRIKVDIYIDTNYASQGDFITPELSSKGLKFRSFANRSTHNQHIEDVEQKEVEIKGKTFHRISLSYVASSLINGEYDLTVDHNIRLIKRSGTPGANRAVVLQRQSKLAKIKIKPLPPAPLDSINTSLVGEWKLSTSLDKKESKVGTPFTLKFTFRGNDGDPERFNISQQSFKYFRLLSEDRKIKDESLDNLSATKTFVLAALGSDVKIPEIKFATFNPIKEQYDIHKAELPAIKFIGNKFTEKKAPPIRPRNTKDKESAPKEVLLDKEVKLPLVSNLHPILFVLASLLSLAYFLKSYTHIQLSPRAQNQKKIRQIRRLLKKASPEKTQMIYKDHLIPLLKKIYSLPLGDSNSQLIEKISKNDLQKILLDYENQRFQADSSKKISGKNLSRALKGLSFLFIFSFSLSNQAQDQNLKMSQEYIQLLESEPESIQHTLNAAFALKEEKQYALAYAYCQKLSRMAPRLEKHKALEQALCKTLKIKVTSPPLLRPDELWSIAITLWIIAFTILCVFRKCPKAITFTLLFVALLSTIYSYQLKRTYWHSHQYLVINKDVKAYAQVNSKSSERSLPKLAMYEALAFSSQRILVKNETSKIWVDRQDLFRIW
ncbi:BatD family protein [Lentisphaera marina]|uniref:BatD family protein n=1 Tax=Lentisphaera marina TaxID=1111041 RepID=UPI0023664528|nr:BatD family protein [Lentisphaera marina]MDD7985697.1 BatD family protein [Lentisphaera marina]